MNQIESLIFLLAAAARLAQLARVLKVPYPILLVIGGLALGFVPGLPDVEIPPEVIFLVFLPPVELGGLLLLSARPARPPQTNRVARRGARARHDGGRRCDRTRPPRSAVGRGLRPRGDPRAHRPRGGRGYLRQVGRAGARGHGRRRREPRQRRHWSRRLPGRRRRGGHGAFSLWEAALSFLLVGGGGLLLGLSLAWLTLPQLARLRDPSILITFSVLIPYAVYILAEEVLHVSGILAVVTYGGLYQGWKSPRLFQNASTRLQTIAFWGVLVFLLEALLFILVGQQLPSILADIEEYSVWEVLFYAALVYAAVVVVRFAWFFTTPYLHPVFDRLLHSRYLRAPWQELLVMSWSGMRGAVSLAAALAVPLSTDAGDPFPGRDLIVFSPSR